MSFKSGRKEPKQGGQEAEDWGLRTEDSGLDIVQRVAHALLLGPQVADIVLVGGDGDG